LLNRVIIIGRLTKDPVVRYLPSGTQVAEFVLAYNRRYMVGEEWKEESHFFDVKAYGKLAENLGVRISKGYTVVVEGRLVQDRWTDKEGNVQSRVVVCFVNSTSTSLNSNFTLSAVALFIQGIAYLTRLFLWG